MATDDIVVRFVASVEQLQAGVDQAKEAIEGISQPISKVISAFSGLGEAIIAAFAVEKVAEFTEKIAEFILKTVEMGDRMEHLSQEIGVSVEEAGGFAFAAGAMGVSVEAAARALERLEANMVQAAAGVGKASSAFKALGIDVKEPSGQLKSLDELLPELANKFEAARNGPEKTAIAIALLGRAGAEMIPFLNKGAEGLAEMKRIGEETGSVMTTQVAKGFEETEIKVYTLKKAWEGLALTFTSLLKPVFDAIVVALTKMLEGFNALLAPTSLNKQVEQLSGALDKAEAEVERINAQMAKSGLSSANAAKLFGLDEATKKAESLRAELNQLIALQGKVKSEESAEAAKPALPTMDAPGKSRIGDFQAQLDQQLQAEKNYFKDSKSESLKFWQEKLQIADLTSNEMNAITGKIYGLEKSLALDAAHAEIASLDEKQAAAKNNFAQVMSLENQKLAFIKEKYGEDSTEYNREAAHRDELQSQHNSAILRMAVEHDNSLKSLDKLKLEDEKTNLEKGTSESIAAADQKYTRLKLITEKIAADEVARAKNEVKLAGDNVAAQQRAADQIVAINAKKNHDILELENQAKIEKSKISLQNLDESNKVAASEIDSTGRIAEAKAAADQKSALSHINLNKQVLEDQLRLGQISLSEETRGLVEVENSKLQAEKTGLTARYNAAVEANQKEQALVQQTASRELSITGLTEEQKFTIKSTSSEKVRALREQEALLSIRFDSETQTAAENSARAIEKINTDSLAKETAEQTKFYENEISLANKAATEKESLIRKDFSNGISTLEQETAQLKQAENERYAATQQYYEKIRGLANQSAEVIKTIENKETADHNAHLNTLQQQEQAHYAQVRANFLTFTSAISSSFGNAISGMILGTETWRQAVANILTDMLNLLIQTVANMVAEWAAGVLTNMFVSKTQAEGNIAASAAEAGAAGVASAAAIPFVGWAMAPEAGAADYAAAIAYAPLAALATGAWEIPQNMAANLHQGEMVVPQTFAAGLRNGGTLGGGDNSSGGGDHFTINIQAVDAKSVHQLFMSNGGALVKALAQQKRNFAMG